MQPRSLGDILGSTAQLQPKRTRDRFGERARRLARGFDDMLSRARTDAERQAVEAAYERAAGERDVQHHGSSDFGEPPAHQGVDAGAVMNAYWAFHDFQHRNRGKGERELPRSYARVLKYLLSIAKRFGRVFPSQATIGKACKLCERQVRNVLAWLRAHGFLDWRRRLRWTENALGQREPRQTSNAYRIALSGLAQLGSALFQRLGVVATTGNEHRVASSPIDALKQTGMFAAQRSGAP